MPYRNLDEVSKIQFCAPMNYPYLINKAAKATDVPSQTRYIQLAVAKALARDLGIPEQEIIASLPPTRGVAAALFGGDRRAIKRTAPRPGR